MAITPPTNPVDLLGVEAEVLGVHRRGVDLEDGDGAQQKHHCE